MGNVSENIKELVDNVKPAVTAMEEHKEATNTVHVAEETIAKNLSSAKAFVKDNIKKAREAREEANEYDAEERAAAEGAPIGLAEAYALVVQEAKADDVADEAAVTALKDSASYVASSVVGTAGVLLDNADAAIGGVAAGVTSPGAVATFGGTVLTGALVGSFIKSESLQSMVINGINMFTGLQSSAEIEGEEKFVGGVTTPEGQGAYMAENGNGEPSDPYAAAQDPGTPDTDEDKEVEQGQKNAATDPNVEATTISDTGLDELADMEKVASGDIFGDTALGKWMDSVSKMFEDKAAEGSTGAKLASAVVDMAAPGLGNVAGKVAEVVTPALSKLMAAKEEVDQNEAAKQSQPEGPGMNV